jgi:hypothetical protein
MAKNYLNNKDMLLEIHKSKMSYCNKDVDEEYFMYDLILDHVDEIDNDKIEEAKVNRASRLTKLAHEEAVKKWEQGLWDKKRKPRAAEFAVDPDTITEKELVFRINTYEHIPLEQRKTNPKTVADHHTKVNFPPFSHYALVGNNWKEVVRSHWKGDLTDGHFSVTHGKTNTNLAKMYLMLCHRYSMRGNWRGYTYVDEMRGQAILQLSQIGLQFNEAKSNNPFAYYTAAVNNSFTRVLNLEKRSQNIRDDLLEEAGLNPSHTRTFNAEWEAQNALELKKALEAKAKANQSEK